MRSLWISLVVFGAFSANISAVARNSDAGADLPREKGVLRVPFKLHRGFAIVVRGSIGTAKNLNFLIDTGASPTVVDCRVARKLRLTLSAGQLSTFTQKVAVEQAMAADIRLGPFHDDELRVLIHDLSGLEKALGVHVDAMVGYDFLKQGSFTIDYVSRNMLFGPIDAGLETIPYVAGLPYVVVLMRVRDAYLPLLVDTGAHDLIVFENGIENMWKTTDEKPSLTWTNLGGEIKVTPLDFSHSLLGPMPWSDREAYLLRGSHTSLSVGFKGLLGVAALQTSRVGFDPARRLFAWDPKIPRFASVSDPRLAENSIARK